MSSLEIGYIIPKTNSAEGVSITHKYFNASDKAMKYITFTYVPFNSVGDMVKCSVSGKVAATGRLTGPIPSKRSGWAEWNILWYNPTITKVALAEVHIEYMDGSEETIKGKDVLDMGAEGSEYYETIEKPFQQEQAIKDRKKEMQQLYYFTKTLSYFKKAKGDDEMKFHLSQGLWLFILKVLATISIVLVPVTTQTVFLAIGAVLWTIGILFSNKCIKAIDNDERFVLPGLGKIQLVK